MKLALRLFFLVAVQLAALKAVAQGTLYTLTTNGSTSQRLNVVIFAEGYTASQVSQFTNDARILANAMLNRPPYSEYTNYFNVFAVFVPSVESGSDHPADNIYHDTYFNSTYDSYGIERALTIPYTGGVDKMNALLASLMPECDLAAVLVNDTEYGGTGGYVLVCSINSQSPDIFIHEAGHTLGGLADEYSDSGSGQHGEDAANVTQQTNRTLIKWNAWINANTPIPTPATDTTDIGLFQGANLDPINWYRPKYMCEMRALGYPFCSVCAEQLVESIYNYVPPIGTSTPATNSTIQLARTGNATFTAVPNQPSAHNLSLQWFANGVPVAGATNAAFNLAGSSLANGANSLKVAVWDPTPLVRTDPDQLLIDARTWSVNVTGSGVLHTNVVSAEVLDGVGINWLTVARANYAVQWSANLGALAGWTNLAPAIVGDGTNKSVFDPIAVSSRKFYRILQSP